MLRLACRPFMTTCTSLALALIACHSDGDQMGSASATAGQPPSAGTVAPTSGTTATPSSSSTSGRGGDSAVAGRSAGTAGIGRTTGSAGIAGASGSSGSGGVANSGGTTGSAGTSGSGAQTNPAGATGGQPSSAGTAGRPGSPTCTTGIGWATRDGRTGGAIDVTGGGAAMPVVVSSFDQLASYAKDGQPRVIHIDGVLGSAWSGNAGDRLELGSNKTIVGLRPNTELKAAIHVKDATNVVIRNLVIRGPGSNSDQAWDNINIEGSSKNIWIDHCEFWDGQDGNADVVKGADNVTFTWNIFGYSIRSTTRVSDLARAVLYANENAERSTWRKRIETNGRGACSAGRIAA